jgi:hypothetical protein
MPKTLVPAALLAALTLGAPAEAQTVSPEAYPFKSGPVTIDSCSAALSNGRVAGNSLEIKYFQNVPGRHLVSVTFRVRFADGGPLTFTDTGTFSFGALIDHHFNNPGGAPWTTPNPLVCRVVTATFGDGQTVTPAYAGDDAMPVEVPPVPPAQPAGTTYPTPPPTPHPPR